jgi:hypothetical protein
MALISHLADYIRGGVAQDTILEGKLGTINQSGILNELPNIRLAASGETNVFVVTIPPDNFARPTNALQYLATDLAVIRGDVNTGWESDPYTDTYYRIGKSALEAPTAYSGERVLIARECTVTVTSGCFVDSVGIKVPGSLVKVADDGTGRFATTTDKSASVGFVEEYDATRNYLVVTLR